MNFKKKVGCVIVTYNRVDLLKQCIEAVLKQDYPLDKIIIIDNCSTDDTKEYLDRIEGNNIICYRLEKNLGGAGGFNFGIKEAIKFDLQYLWIMDDDTIVESNSLSCMINNEKLGQIGKWGFLSSNVLWTDNKPCIMNIPQKALIWNEFICDGFTKISSSSFVSLLIPVEVIKEVGLPIKDFFIWGDDLEYTLRISNNLLPGYLVHDSKVIHKMNSNKTIDIVKDSIDRIDRYYYNYRNTTYIYRKMGIKKSIVNFMIIINSIKNVVIYSRKNKMKKIKIILKGFFAGLFFNPIVEGITKEMYNE